MLLKSIRQPWLVLGVLEISAGKTFIYVYYENAANEGPHKVITYASLISTGVCVTFESFWLAEDLLDFLEAFRVVGYYLERFIYNPFKVVFYCP
jgi:hypothetical protein